MKTTTILTIIAIVGAVAATGLVSTIGLATPAHAGACSTHFDIQSQTVTKEHCSSTTSSGKAFNSNFHEK
jgi:hypothetical protein